MLKRVFGKLINGINVDNFTVTELVSVWHYWQELYLMHEEYLTFEETKKVDKAMKILWSQLEKRYPHHNATNYLF